jgi:uncharacterized membrane protein
MDLVDVLGYGVCHREPGRSMEGAWLCYRCTGLFAGGLVGVFAARRFDRALGIGVQVMVCGLLVVPIAVDTQFFGRGSPIDVGWWRLVTGAAAGLGSGLFTGARAHTHLGWPAALQPLARTAHAWGPLLVVVAIGLRVAGVAVGLDLVVGAGLASLCLAGTAWALAIARWSLRRVGVRLGERPFPALWLAAAVVAELAFVSVLPNQYKPSGLWLRPLLELLGLRQGG